MLLHSWESTEEITYKRNPRVFVIKKNILLYVVKTKKQQNKNKKELKTTQISNNGKQLIDGVCIYMVLRYAQTPRKTEGAFLRVRI